MTALALIAAACGITLLAWLCWPFVKTERALQDGALREPLDGWPKMNVGGGYEWQDGSCTRHAIFAENRWPEDFYAGPGGATMPHRAAKRRAQ